jgi:hypothetical protein
MVMGSDLCLGVNGEVHGRVFESLSWGQWRCCAWTCVRIFNFLGSVVV